MDSVWHSLNSFRVVIVVKMMIRSRMIIWGGGGGMIGDWVYFLFILLIGLWPGDMPATYTTEPMTWPSSRVQCTVLRIALQACTEEKIWSKSIDAGAASAACALSFHWVSPAVESLTSLGSYIVIDPPLWSYIVWRGSQLRGVCILRMAAVSLFCPQIESLWVMTHKRCKETSMGIPMKRMILKKGSFAQNYFKASSSPSPCALHWPNRR